MRVSGATSRKLCFFVNLSLVLVQCGAQGAKCRVKGLALLNGTAKLYEKETACSLHSTSLVDSSIVCG